MVNPYRLHHCSTCEMDFQKKMLLPNARCPSCGRFVSSKSEFELGSHAFFEKEGINLNHPKAKMIIALFNKWEERKYQNEKAAQTQEIITEKEREKRLKELEKELKE